MQTLPVIGAAMMIADIAAHRDFLFEKDRAIELQDFCEFDVMDGDWTSAVDAALKALDGHKGPRGIHGPFWGLSVASKDPAIRAVVTRRLQYRLDVCARLKADMMVIHSPYTTWDHFNLPNHAGGEERMIERAHDTVKDVVRRAEDLGVTLVLENIEDNDPFIRVRLAESFASPAIAVSIDTGHAHYAHGVTGAPPVDYYVHAAGEHLRHVHLQDADGYADRHWEIGKGTIRWDSVFAAFAALPQSPRLLLELNDVSRIPASMAFLEAAGLGQ